MKTLFDSLVRTFTPIIVGGVLAWFTTAGITLDSEFEGALTLAVSGLFAGFYYLAVRLFGAPDVRGPAPASSHLQLASELPAQMLNFAGERRSA